MMADKKQSDKITEALSQEIVKRDLDIIRLKTHIYTQDERIAALQDEVKELLSEKPLTDNSWPV